MMDAAWWTGMVDAGMVDAGMVDAGMVDAAWWTRHGGRGMVDAAWWTRHGGRGMVDAAWLRAGQFPRGAVGVGAARSPPAGGAPRSASEEPPRGVNPLTRYRSRSRISRPRVSRRAGAIGADSSGHGARLRTTMSSSLQVD
jgi:hypothetical protein